MRNQENPSWNKVAEILQRIESMHKGHSADVPSVDEQVSSSSGSADTRPKEFGSRDPQERDYVRAVLDCYVRLPGPSTVTSRHDRRCAQQLYRRGVPLAVVRSAMVVAVARRTFRSGDPLPRVRAVHYFLPVVEEMLEHRLQPLAAAKAAESGRRRSGPSC